MKSTLMKFIQPFPQPLLLLISYLFLYGLSAYTWSITKKCDSCGKFYTEPKEPVSCPHGRTEPPANDEPESPETRKNPFKSYMKQAIKNSDLNFISIPSLLKYSKEKAPLDDADYLPEIVQSLIAMDIYKKADIQTALTKKSIIRSLNYFYEKQIAIEHHIKIEDLREDANLTAYFRTEVSSEHPSKKIVNTQVVSATEKLSLECALNEHLYTLSSQTSEAFSIISVKLALNKYFVITPAGVMCQVSRKAAKRKGKIPAKTKLSKEQTLAFLNQLKVELSREQPLESSLYHDESQHISQLSRVAQTLAYVIEESAAEKPISSESSPEGKASLLLNKESGDDSETAVASLRSIDNISTTSSGYGASSMDAKRKERTWQSGIKQGSSQPSSSDDESPPLTKQYRVDESQSTCMHPGDSLSGDYSNRREHSPTPQPDYEDTVTPPYDEASSPRSTFILGSPQQETPTPPPAINFPGVDTLTTDNESGSNIEESMTGHPPVSTNEYRRNEEDGPALDNEPQITRSRHSSSNSERSDAHPSIESNGADKPRPGDGAMSQYSSDDNEETDSDHSTDDSNTVEYPMRSSRGSVSNHSADELPESELIASRENKWSSVLCNRAILSATAFIALGVGGAYFYSIYMPF